MKKNIIIFYFGLICTFSYSQITLDGTLTNSNYSEHLNWFETKNFGIMYYNFSNTVVDELVFYEEDLSVYRTITITPPADYSTHILFPCDSIFNNDEKLEFLISHTNNGTGQQQVKLMNEDLDILYDFGTYFGWLNPYIVSSEGNSKLIFKGALWGSDYFLEIYSINITGLSTNSQYRIEKHPYPNPTGKSIALPYSLENSKNQVMNIFSSNGTLIDQFQIKPNENKLIINIENYSPGVYFYKYSNESKKFIVK